MRYVLLAAMAIAGCQSGALREAAVLRPPGLSGPWIGLASDGLTYYRLQLDKEGTGLCATATGANTALYRVREWTVADRVLTIHLELSEGAPDTARLLVLKGTAGPTQLDLVAQERHTLTLWRERDLLAAREELAKRMEGPRG